MMKKLLCLLLAMTMLMGSMFILTACDEKKDEKSTEEATEKEEFKLPEGYALYENKDISVAYPSDWTKTDMGDDVGALIMDGTTGNNITVVPEAFEDIYKNMTVKEFNETIKPQLTASGMTVSNVKVDQVKGTNDLAVTKISYTAKASGVSMTQITYVVPAGEFNYFISITETKTVEGLAETVLASLTVK